MNNTVRILIGALAAIAIGATAWIISLPNMDECRASGRIVDPTERHCESGATFQQLQEHATFHAIQVVVLFLVALAGAYVLYRIIRRIRRSNATILLGAAAMCVVGVGCDTKNADKDVPSREMLRGTASATPFRIIATDSGFNAPNNMAAGLRHIVFENRGSEIHEAMLIKLPKGMSANDYVAAVKSGSLFPQGSLDYSGPGLTSPGEVVELWLRVDPGEYILLCWFKAHDIHRFTVNDENSADDEPPQEDAVLKLIDFRFALEGTLEAGVQSIRVETPGPSMHEVDFFRLHEGKTLADVRQWWKQKREAPAPADAVGGALDSHDLGRVVWLRRKFSPGRYVLHCSMPISMDAKAGSGFATHADAGMVTEFEIRN